ncbi:polysaccharide pyruvyl transferase family protein [Bradyrhizobium sp. 8-10B]|uniref:polysaccharide pyruvyl transferase family protein n=1 Tax=Bradyrhizobium sp. 8-10B TaxID=3344579 RepID=UPI0035C264A9
MSAPPAPLAFWCRTPSRPNFGDALTPWLIHRLSGSHPRFVPPSHGQDKFFVTGSIVSLARANCIVWGCGIMNADDRISTEARLLAVRGPLTRRRALACGADCPEVYGDPALLLPRLFAPPRAVRRSPSLAPHFSDVARLDAAGLATSGLRVIDLQSPIETVITKICQSEWLVSSSLHGLIVSHAYSIPAVWIKFRDLPSGDGSKFRDYYASLGIDGIEPIAVNGATELGALERHAWCPQLIDTDRLWRACPFANSAVRSETIVQ